MGFVSIPSVMVWNVSISNWWEIPSLYINKWDIDKWNSHVHVFGRVIEGCDFFVRVWDGNAHAPCSLKLSQSDGILSQLHHLVLDKHMHIFQVIPGTHNKSIAHTPVWWFSCTRILTIQDESWMSAYSIQYLLLGPIANQSRVKFNFNI